MNGDRPYEKPFERVLPETKEVTHVALVANPPDPNCTIYEAAPFSLPLNKNTDNQIFDATGEMIGWLYQGNKTRDRYDAMTKFVIAACNCHNELADQLERMINGLQWRMENSPETIDESDHEEIAAARKSLLKFKAWRK